MERTTYLYSIHVQTAIIIEGGDVVDELRERILGRVTAVDVYKPGGDDLDRNGAKLTSIHPLHILRRLS
jgi:hypothetical protein